jgi:hypothetical protein
MYFGDHSPAHFHAEYGEFSAQLSIRDLGILEGYLPPKALGLVVEWASVHKEELFDNWENLTKGGNGVFRKIEPLK